MICRIVMAHVMEPANRKSRGVCLPGANTHGEFSPVCSIAAFSRTPSTAYVLVPTNTSGSGFSVLNIGKFLEIPATMVGDVPLHKLNKSIYEMISNVKPHMVFCPFPDRHIDHRLVFDSVMVATRPIGVGKKIEIVAAYETLSETHWNAPHIEANFTPNWIIDITENIEKKLKALRCYKSQISEFPNPRSIEAVEALAKFRGSQAGFAFGEGMHIIRKIS